MAPGVFLFFLNIQATNGSFSKLDVWLVVMEWEVEGVVNSQLGHVHLKRYHPDFAGPGLSQQH